MPPICKPHRPRVDAGGQSGDGHGRCAHPHQQLRRFRPALLSPAVGQLTPETPKPKRSPKSDGRNEFLVIWEREGEFSHLPPYSVFELQISGHNPFGFGERLPTVSFDRSAQFHRKQSRKTTGQKRHDEIILLIHSA